MSLFCAADSILCVADDKSEISKRNHCSDALEKINSNYKQ